GLRVARPGLAPPAARAGLERGAPRADAGAGAIHHRVLPRHPQMSLLGLGVLLILLGGAAAVVLRKQPRLADRTFAALVAAGCVALAIPAIRVLSGDRLEPVSVVPTLPGGTWVIALDALSAW